jgi:hypothetical protein
MRGSLDAHVKSGPCGPLRIAESDSCYLGAVVFFFSLSVELVAALLAEAVVLLDSDWSPVVVVVLLLSD